MWDCGEEAFWRCELRELWTRRVLWKGEVREQRNSTHLCDVVEFEARLAFWVEISAVLEAVVLAYQHLNVDISARISPKKGPLLVCSPPSFMLRLQKSSQGINSRQ